MRVSLPKRTSSKTHRATDIHWIPENIEREPFNSVVHEDAEVVTEEGAGNAQGPCRGDDESLAREEKDGRYDPVVRLGKNWMLGLFLQGSFISTQHVSRQQDRKIDRDSQGVSQDTKRENEHSQEVAPSPRVTAKELRYCLVPIF